MAIQCFSHLGLCVADLARAQRFYVEGLGFAPEATLRVAGEPSTTLLDLDPVDLDAVYLVRDGLRLELLHFIEPGVEPAPAPRPINRCGLTHLSLRVDDLDACLTQLTRLGGRVLEASRIGVPERGAGAAFVLDPDGTRIELVQAPGDPTQPPGGATPAR